MTRTSFFKSVFVWFYLLYVRDYLTKVLLCTREDQPGGEWTSRRGWDAGLPWLLAQAGFDLWMLMFNSCIMIHMIYMIYQYMIYVVIVMVMMVILSWCYTQWPQEWLGFGESIPSFSRIRRCRPWYHYVYDHDNHDNHDHGDYQLWCSWWSLWSCWLWCNHKERLTLQTRLRPETTVRKTNQNQIRMKIWVKVKFMIILFFNIIYEQNLFIEDV